MPLITSEFKAQVNSNGKGQCLLPYLVSRFTYKSKENWEEVIESGLITVNGWVREKDFKLSENDQLIFQVVDYLEPEVPTDFKILSRKGPLLFVHKPAGLPVHRTGRIFFNTLVNLVRQSEKNEKLSPLHRLDAETSGIVIFSESSEEMKKFSNNKPENFWIKNYVALTPRLKGSKSGLIHQALGMVKGSDIRCQMHPLHKGKDSMSYFEEISQSDTHSLLAITPITGRKHQIRAHLSFLGFPIVGDKIYSHRGKYFLKRLTKELCPEDYSVLGSMYHKLHCFSITHYRGKRVHLSVEDNFGLEQFQTPYRESFDRWVASSQITDYKEQVKQIANSFYGE